MINLEKMLVYIHSNAILALFLFLKKELYLYSWGLILIQIHLKRLLNMFQFVSSDSTNLFIKKKKKNP